MAKKLKGLNLYSIKNVKNVKNIIKIHPKVYKAFMKCEIGVIVSIISPFSVVRQVT